jgi:ABC-2 type transport system ATP-binding protein
VTDSGLAISVRHLNKSFGGKPVVQDVSIDVPRGQIFGFLGPNGSGKTTTIRLLCGLLTPDSGSGTCLGLDIIKQTDLVKRQVGYMTQKFSLYEDLTIRENLEFVARVYEIDAPQKAARDALVRLGLETRQNQLAGTLSGGWKQRLALAACMLHQPKLLLLDEPTAGVDPKARRDFWDEIHELAAGGLTVLVSTHYMDEAERCHEIGYIAYGRLMTHGTVAKVIAESGLHTCAIYGANSAKLAATLALADPALLIAPFGNSLHVSANEKDRLDRAIAQIPAQAGIEIVDIAPSLEDVFIYLMRQSTDNFA